MDLEISVTRKIANVLLPVRVAGKSHAGWSRPALHAAPTNPPQRRQLSCWELAGTGRQVCGGYFTKRRKLLLGESEERKEPRGGLSFSDSSIQQPQQKA